MRLRLMRSKAQSTAEYAIVIGLVIAAAIAMQVYVRRQMQGKIRDATNYTDADAQNKYGIGGGGTDDQYEPYYASSDVNSTSKQEETVKATTGGAVNRELAQGDDLRNTRQGSQDIAQAPN